MDDLFTLDHVPGTGFEQRWRPYGSTHEICCEV